MSPVALAEARGPGSRETSVVVNQHTVTKRSDPTLMRLEVLKTRCAHQIARDTGLFLAPEVLDFDERTGTAVFERILGAVQLRRPDPTQPRESALLERIGRSLAAVHARMRLPPELRVALPEELSSAEGGKVVLHGDLTGDNVLVHADGRTPVLIDWQMTRVHGGRASVGTPWFDLAWFINFQFYELFPHRASLRTAGLSSTAFLRGYFSDSRLELARDGFASYLAQFATYKIACRRRDLPLTTWLRLLPAHHRFRKYAERGIRDALL